MQRRRVLGCVGSGFVAGLAGCLSEGRDALRESREAIDETHPLAETSTVRVDDVSESAHDLTAITRDALDFWEEHSQEYAGFETGFELVETEPDVIIAYADDAVGCEDVAVASEEVLGCAPIVDEDFPTDQPVTARVVAGDRPPGMIEVTAKHEVGHLLGLKHHDEPEAIMSSNPSKRIPQYELRLDIWEHVREAKQDGTDGVELFNAGVSDWENEQFEPAHRKFSDAAKAFGRAAQAVERAQTDLETFEEEADRETLDSKTLEKHLDQLERRMETAETFGTSMNDAANGAASHNREQAAEYAEQADEEMDAFTDLSAPTIRDIVVSLGLVRDFDNDESVIEMED